VTAAPTDIVTTRRNHHNARTVSGVDISTSPRASDKNDWRRIQQRQQHIQADIEQQVEHRQDRLLVAPHPPNVFRDMPDDSEESDCCTNCDDYYNDDDDESSFEDNCPLEGDNATGLPMNGAFLMKMNQTKSSRALAEIGLTEMYENEKYAAAAGLYFSSHGGDRLMRSPAPPSYNVSRTAQTTGQRLTDKYGNPISYERYRREQQQSCARSNASTYFTDDEASVIDELDSDLPPNADFLYNGNQDDMNRLRMLAGNLNADWRGSDYMAPALARRLRDFQFAQEKRRKKYGKERPWGILGLYDHLASVRMDVEWAEDAAWRRQNCEPYLAWSDFEASKGSGFNRPFFTYLTLIVCTGVLVTSIALNGWRVERLDINPMIGPSADTLLMMGAKQANLIVNEKEFWRLFSPMGLHAGAIHFFLNMLALWFVGSAVEKSHGFCSAFVLFVVPAVGGTILSAIFLPAFVSVGASGGIFGLIGACLSDILMNWRLLFSDFVGIEGKKNHHIMVVVFLVLDIIVNCLVGLTPFVDNFTHLGGMLFGFLCGLSTMERVSPDFFGDEERCWSKTKHLFYRFFGIMLSLVGIAVTTIVLFNGDGRTTPCPACKAFSCIPFPWWEAENNKWWYCDDCSAVTANAVMDSETGFFDKVAINCPNGEISTFNVDGDTSLDKDSLEIKLPGYCRQFCDVGAF